MDQVAYPLGFCERRSVPMMCAFNDCPQTNDVAPRALKKIARQRTPVVVNVQN
jgi:hypothetical protein